MAKSLMHWKTAESHLDKAKVKDPGLVLALKGILDASLRDDEYEKRIGYLAAIVKYAGALAKTKGIVAAGPKVVQQFEDCADSAADSLKETQAAQRDAARTGLHPVDVQVTVSNWDGKPFGNGYSGYAEFRSPGVEVVRAQDVLTGNGLEINDVRVRPVGTLYLIVRRRMETKDVYVEGTAPYKFEPGKRDTVLTFEAVQNNKVMKLRAKTTEEVTDKLGVKGGIGIEWKVLKINGEVAKETEYRKGFESEVEWEVDYGIDSFKSFKVV